MLGLRPFRGLLDRLGVFWGLLRGLQFRHAGGQGRVCLREAGDDAVQGVRLVAAALQLPLEEIHAVPQVRYGCVFCFEEGVLPMSCRVLAVVLSRPAGVQEDPHAPVLVLLVGDGLTLDALSEGVYGGAEVIGRLRDANTLGGRLSCRVLSDVLSHAGILDPSEVPRRAGERILAALRHVWLGLWPAFRT